MSSGAGILYIFGVAFIVAAMLGAFLKAMTGALVIIAALIGSGLYAYTHSGPAGWEVFLWGLIAIPAVIGAVCGLAFTKGVIDIRKSWKDRKRRSAE